MRANFLQIIYKNLSEIEWLELSLKPLLHIAFVCAQHEHVRTSIKALNKFVKYKF